MSRLSEITDEIESRVSRAEEEIASAGNVAEVDELRRTYLGKKGYLTQILRQIGDLPEEERPELGKRVNAIKERLTHRIREQTKALEIKEIQEEVAAETIDITMPGTHPPHRHPHPVKQVLDEINHIFVSMGFKIATGPDIETDYNNFEALNIPADHPARDMQDTFYLEENLVLRTHTSPVQIRVMQEQAPPIAIVAPGRVFRCDADVSHSPMFHQVEGLLVNHEVSFSNLKAVLNTFAEQMFGKETSTRFRASYFPFTEPSAEMDIECLFCGGKGCSVCQRTGWLEVIGCGMVHPAVFENVNINPQEFSGFAFGMGVERLAMLKFGINDIRLFFEGDLRFIDQF